MGFRKTYTILRESAGDYVGGVWVPGTRSVLTVQASMQPARLGQDMEALPEGRRLSHARKLYTTSELQVTEQGDGVQPDLVLYSGYGYEITSIEEHQSDVIDHYKYICYKSIPVSSTAAWLDGTIIRP